MIELRAGIHYLDGRVRCPFAGIGSRGATASNRIVVGGDATVVVDPARRRITVHDDRDYAEPTVIADLTFLADGITRRGARIPFALHLKIEKHGRAIELDLHRHLRTQDALVDAELECFEVVLADGTVVLDRAKAMAMIRRPPLRHRIIKAFMAMRSAPVAGPTDRPGFALADLTLGFGLARLGWMLARAQLVSLVPAADLRGARGADLLARGGFELSVTALSDRWLPEVVQRDLYLFGLDEVPLLAGVRARGLRRGQTLGFRVAPDGGAVRLDDRVTPLPAVHDVARAYLEFHMLGGLLAEHAERFVDGLA